MTATIRHRQGVVSRVIPNADNERVIRNEGLRGAVPGAFTPAPGALAAGQVGFPYSVTLNIGTGQTPQHFVLAGGALPPGLSIKFNVPNVYQVTGIPTAPPGAFAFSVRAYNRSGARVQDYTLTVTP